MNKKIILTSFVALGFACPAMAINQSNEFPNASNGQYMQEDMQYLNAATSTNMAGVYQGTVYANPQFVAAEYSILPGSYLPANSEESAICNVNGYFCAGLEDPVNYQSTAQGLTQCPEGYTNSANGSVANTDCYRSCTTDDVPNSSTVSGRVYYNSTKTCEAISCVNGWHTAQIKNHAFSGTSDAYTDNSGSFHENSASLGQSAYGIASNDKNAFAVKYKSGLDDKGTIVGHARCSTLGGSTVSSLEDTTTFESLTDETGQTDAIYCYCRPENYIPTSGTTEVLSSRWVLTEIVNTGAVCADNCAHYCSSKAREQGGSGPILAYAFHPTCDANIITITWDGATQSAIDANSAGTATYGSDIRTPQSAIHVPGKVFKGWRFSTTAPSEPVGNGQPTSGNL